jgi:hypothetical protein
MASPGFLFYDEMQLGCFHCDKKREEYKRAGDLPKRAGKEKKKRLELSSNRKQKTQKTFF